MSIDAPQRRRDDYTIEDLLDVRRRDRVAFQAERYRQAVVDSSTSDEIAPYLEGSVLNDVASTSMPATCQHAVHEEATFWRALDDVRHARRQRAIYQGLAVAAGGFVLATLFGLALLAVTIPPAALVLIVAILVAGAVSYAFRTEIGDRLTAWQGDRGPVGWTELWRRADEEAVLDDLKRWQTALQEGFLPYLRERMAVTVSMPRFRRHAGSAPGLRQPFDVRFHVVTETGNRLARLLRDMDGGSIALAGPRGTGKTNLIEAIIAGHYRGTIPGVAVVMPAPVRYEPRDFVLQLYAAACEQVIDVSGRFQRPGAHAQVRGLVSGAQTSLRHIRYLQTTTNQAGISLRGINIGGAMSHARQVLTYPEIVEGFRAFLERVAAVLSSEASNTGVTVPVLIAIDELDRMGSAENARTFLNEVKGIFNAKGCRFVVSIADETLQTFELLGTPLDLVVDRAFDEVLHMDYIDHDTARRLLIRRVIPPLEDAHVTLCYCLSGGIARDAVRAARTIAGIGMADRGREGHGADENDSLTILGELVAHEMQTAVRLSRNRLLDSGAEPFATDSIGWLDPWFDLRGSDLGPLRDLLAHTTRHELPADAPKELEPIWNRLLAVTYFLITLLDVFAGEDVTGADLANESRLAHLTTLARSRRVLRTNDRLARALLDRFRGDWGLEPLNNLATDQL